MDLMGIVEINVHEINVQLNVEINVHLNKFSPEVTLFSKTVLIRILLQFFNSRPTF